MYYLYCGNVYKPQSSRPKSAVQIHTNMISAPKSLKSKSGKKKPFSGSGKRKNIKPVTIKGYAKQLTYTVTENSWFLCKGSYSNIT